VLVSVPAGRGAAFVAKARSFGPAVRVERTPAVHTQAFYGGQAIYHGGSRCSAGFNTRSGSGRNYVLTAGHCTDLGGNWTTSSGQTIGPVAASSFPGNDYGAIRISNPASLDPRGGVLHNGAFRDITGASRVPVGSSACKTGSTTGTTCGTVQAYNVTVNYAEGTVFGMTRTNICTQPGDSGGAMYAGSLAQGIVSGGTIGGCSQSGFRSFFQPADEPLSTWGLTLL
ncbi:MAG TPA: S1 family peptidase, partial [Actinomycetota bacterium]|nr:S1 family peptidase [Actinomycetota bacterium]